MDKTHIRLLLIEDNPSDVLMLREDLGRDALATFVLTAVERLGPALAMLQTNGFDTILLDLNLPDSQGLDTFNRVHQIAPEIPIIILSGMRDEAFALEAVHAGAQDYLVKGPEGFSSAARAIRYALERQQAQTALRVSEENFSKVFKSSPLALVITDLSTARFVEMNNAYTEMVGYTRAELIGHLTTESNTDVSLDDRQKILVALAASGSVRNFETTIRKKTGEIISVLAFQELIKFNHKTCVLSTLVDITERKQAEEKLRESEQQYRYLFENNPHSMWAYDLETLQFLAVNDAAIEKYGYTRAEFLNMTIVDIRPTEDVERLKNNLEQPRSPLKHSGSWRHKLKDGSVIDVEITSHTLNLAGRPAALVVAQDITARKRADLALRESEEKYRGLMESLDGVITTVDYEGRYLYMNDVAAAQLGSNARELTGKAMHEIFPEPFASVQLEDIRKVIREDKASVYETQMFLQGKMRWYRSTIQPLHDASGRVTSVLINSTDIHNLKTAQKELQELNITLEKRVEKRTAEVKELYDNLQYFFDTASDLIQNMNEDGDYIYVNKAWCETLGYSAEEARHLTMFDVIDPAQHASCRALLQSLRVEQHPQEIEIIFKTKEGENVVVEGSLSSRKEKNGHITTNGIFRDVTRRRQAEHALRESEEQNRLLFEEAPDAVALFDDDGHVIRMNRAFEIFTGYPRDRFSHLKLDEIGVVSASQLEQMVTAVEQAFRSNSDVATAEIKITRANGEVRDAGLKAFSLELQGHRRYLVTFRDVTLEKQAEETLRLANTELARALRLKDEFLANMSHELRTPLNAILGLSESLLEKIAGPVNAKQEKYLNTVIESGQHLLELINDILDIAKVESGQVKLELAMVDVRRVCDASLRMIKQLSYKKNQSVEVEIEKEAAAVWADERRLKQMIVNLLSNAVKFTPEGGKLGLNVHIDHAALRLMITVWDNGIGIRPQDLTRLFQPFVQLDSSLSRESGGTGLGLTLVAQMARLHGGSVTVSSEIGQGSRFTIILPWEPTTAYSTREKLGDGSKIGWVKSVGGPQHTILLVEDTDSVVTIVKDYLDQVGYIVEVARNGVEGISKAVTLQPDLILMDVQMPGMDGLEATGKIRQEDNLKQIPILALTALAMPGDRERCLAAGMNDYISKPINLRELASVVQGYLINSGKK